MRVQKWILVILSFFIVEQSFAQSNGNYLAVAGASPKHGPEEFIIGSQNVVDIEVHALLSQDPETCQFADSIYLEIVNNSPQAIPGFELSYQLNNLDPESYTFDSPVSALESVVVNLGYFDFSGLGGTLMTFEVSLTDPDYTDELTSNNLLEVILPNSNELEILKYKANDCDASVELSIIDHDFETISWSNGTEGPFIVVDENGIYTVEATDSSGCVYTSEYELIIE